MEYYRDHSQQTSEGRYQATAWSMDTVRENVDIIFIVKSVKNLRL